MSLPVTFRRAARAEFFRSGNMVRKPRPNLGVEFIAEIERCVAAAAERPATYSAIHMDVRRVVASIQLRLIRQHPDEAMRIE
jgi:hypothetical protein